MTEPQNGRDIPYLFNNPYRYKFVEEFKRTCEGHSLEDIGIAVWDLIERFHDDWESDHSWN